MTTSAMPDILTSVLEQEPIAPEKIVYLQARVRLRLHDFILRRFAAAEDGPDNLDQAKIARRLHQSRARVSQQLGVPGNWTIDSVTKLAAAMGGEIDFVWVPFPQRASSDETLAAMASHITTGQQNRALVSSAQPPRQANASAPLLR